MQTHLTARTALGCTLAAAAVTAFAATPALAIPDEDTPAVLSQNLAVTNPGGQPAPVTQGVPTAADTDIGYVGALIEDQDGYALRFDRVDILNSAEVQAQGRPPPPNDYELTNVNPLLRDVSLADDVEVSLLSGAETMPATLHELAQSLPGGQLPVLVDLTYDETGEVTEIIQHYLP